MWNVLGTLPPSQLSDARAILHWAAQLPAAPGTSWLDANEDFSHTNLGWEAALGRLTGRPLDDNQTRAALKISTLELAIVTGEDEVLTTFSLGTQSYEAAKNWLASELGKLGLGASKKLESPAFEMPEHPVATGEAFEVGELGAALGELELWVSNAHHLLTKVVAPKAGASETRLWPHHLDIATLVPLSPDESGEDAKSVNAGLSLGDGSYAQPYFYVSPWPYPQSASPHAPLTRGHWHSEGFYAAVLMGEGLVASGPVGQGQRAETFVREAFQASRHRLGFSSAPVRSPKLAWFPAAQLEELPEGRVKTVNAGHAGVCLTRHKGCYGALTNACPHQGGPLGEGSIEKGLLRCPWHGWDFDPLTGKSPEGHDDGLETFAVEVRSDGVYVGLEHEDPHEATTSDVMAQTMVAWGVKWVFGMVGHSNLGLADAIRRRTQVGELGYVGIRHEGAAAFAVSAYGKLTGRPAAALAIAGPGATNLLTGLWDAHVDRAPALALTGQVKSQFLGRGAFQEIDLKAAFGGVAAFSANVLHDSDHAELMNLACKNAQLQRGVAHLIFPDEVQMLPAGDAKPGTPSGRLPDLRIAPPAEALAQAAQALGAAQRPIIIVGHGARAAMPQITDFAEALGIPVLTTFKAKGLISDHHPLGCGVLGRSGTPVASWFMNESDLLLVLGSSFSNHTGITDYKRIIQVDFEADALGRRHPVEFPLLGDIATTVLALREALPTSTAFEDQRTQVAERWAIWREEKQSRRDDDQSGGLNSAMIFDALSRKAPENAIIAVDVGNNTYSFGRYFEAQQHDVLMSGYLGSIGFGLPAAMGAWVATQEEDPRFAGRKVMSVSGDGGLGQYLTELTTLAKYSMNITHVLLNNGELGKISKEQRGGGWDKWETGLHNPNFADFATNCGLLGIRVTDPSELEPALERALAHEGPSLVEIMADVAAI